jgi:hypothetical protein
VKEILHEEISQINNFLKSKEELLKPLILAAGEKLKAYVTNESEICSILVKAFPAEIERDIRRFCPARWKRQYTIEEDDTPESLEIEAFQLFRDAFADLADIMDSFLAEFRRSEPERQKQMISDLISEFGSFAEFEKFAENAKELSIQTAKIKIAHDRRIELDSLTKFLIRIQTFYMSKNHLEKLYNISSKWIKQDIENNTELEDLARKIFMTDLKFKKISEWFEESLIRQKRGVEIQPIPSIVKFEI